MKYIVYELIAPNNKRYIGVTRQDFKQRLREHKSRMKDLTKTKLYDSLRKYGIDNFQKNILLICDENNVDYYETELIKKYDCKNTGLNIDDGGVERKIISKETGRKISKALKGRKQSKETCENITLGLNRMYSNMSKEERKNKYGKNSNTEPARKALALKRKNKNN